MSEILGQSSRMFLKEISCWCPFIMFGFVFLSDFEANKSDLFLIRLT